MRFEAPLYDGDSLIRPGPVVSGAAPSVPAGGDEAPKMLRRTPACAPAAIDDADLAEIEARARKLRAEMIAGWFERLGERLNNWLEAARRRRAEEYLARAQSHAELEARLRELERRGYVPHI